ncbi:hypothetical protein HDV57DRAFT_82827 [Trichoderma longibrachiatum]|uniref:Uncharacterized protein n=1 Tax=Trichoderma longibrachiatum ATCC 18648 TaxID=983965 RepID=A0A2T4CEN0_TRILO|nr:hypothetical protein M440DRAFT_1108152 [Trichoderma longibrachiatum ATCC 18648]
MNLGSFETLAARPLTCLIMTALSSVFAKYMYRPTPAKPYIQLSTCVPYTRARYSYMNASYCLSDMPRASRSNVAVLPSGASYRHNQRLSPPALPLRLFSFSSFPHPLCNSGHVMHKTGTNRRKEKGNGQRQEILKRRGR